MMQPETNSAVAMLAAFASVGTRSFDVTVTDIRGQKIDHGFRPNVPLQQLRRVIGEKLAAGSKLQHNFIVRPRPDLLQLDDLDSAKMQLIAPHAFMVIETSPGNFQAWLAMRDMPEDKTAAQDIVRRIRKGAGADITASGSTRIAGSLNFKIKYEPNFPRVELRQVNGGNFTTPAALHDAGLIAPSEKPRRPTAALSRGSYRGTRRRRETWPNYAMCLDGAPPSKSRPGKTRDSLADFTWCRTAIEWGWSVEATAARLMVESRKARENGQEYALRTARQAAASVNRDPYHGSKP